MNNEFDDKVDAMFEENLKYEDFPVIRVECLRENKILETINYSKLRFDSDLNMYKLTDDGIWVIVNNPNYKPVVVFKEKVVQQPPI